MNEFCLHNDASDNRRQVIRGQDKNEGAADDGDTRKLHASKSDIVHSDIIAYVTFTLMFDLLLTSFTCRHGDSQDKAKTDEVLISEEDADVCQ